MQEFEGTFWVHDDASGAWVARRFRGGRRLVNKLSRTGKITVFRCGQGVRFRSNFEVQQKGKGKTKGKFKGPNVKTKELVLVDWTKGEGQYKIKPKSNKGTQGKGYTAEEASLPETETQGS